MFQIKICGIKSVKDAHLAMLAGADAVGLNFYERSARCVPLELAQQICRVLPAGRIEKVGVFVNAASDEIRHVAQQLDLRTVQLHGDEPPEVLAQLGDLQIIRAFRFAEKSKGLIREYLEKCRHTRMPDAVLVDAFKPGEYGGTGETFDWKLLAEHRDIFAGLPLVLAGGLTPFNVTEAIAAAAPQAVDTASGVETAQGQKDPMLVRAFVSSARKAFAAAGG